MLFSQPKANKSKKIISPQINHGKRVSLSASFYGSLSVEAAIILPVFIFFLLIVISPLLLFKTQLIIHERLTDCCLMLSEYYYPCSKINDAENNIPDYVKDITLNGVSTAYAKNYILDNSLKKKLHNSLIHNKENGLSFKYSSINKASGIIDISIDYSAGISLPMIAKLPYTKFIQRCYIKGFCGKSIVNSNNSVPVYVYVSSGSTAYHKTPYCSYLLHYSTVVRSKFSTTVFVDGNPYDCCTFCMLSDESLKDLNDKKFFYITDYGSVFHTSLDCPVLQRNIFAIDYNTGTGGRSPCIRCYN